jgi:hypothetical protein
MMATKEELHLALRWYPFGDDEPHAGDRCLSDKLVIGRKSYECQWCGQPTVIGTINRVRSDVYAGELATYRYCEDCCKAMVALVTGDDWDAIQKRYELRTFN